MPRSRSKRPLQVLRRSASVGLKAFIYLLVGLLLALALVLFAINLAPVNRWVAGKVSDALEPTFEGRLVLRRLGHLDLGGIAGAELEVFDPAGASVLTASGVDVRLFWPGLVWRAVVERPETLSIEIDRVALDEVSVTVIDDGAGVPTLAAAFEPKQADAEEPNGGGTALSIDELSIREVRVRGALSALDPIDVDLRGLSARLDTTPSGTRAVLERLELEARQLPVVGTVSGALKADVSLPADPPAPELDRQPPIAGGARGASTQIHALSPAPARHIAAELDARVGGSPAHVEVRLDGEQLRAHVAANEIAPETLSNAVPALAPTAPLALSATVEGALRDLAFEARLAQRAAEVRAEGRVARQEERSKVTAGLSASQLDLSQLLPELASTRLNVSADAELELDERGGHGTYRVRTRDSSYAGEALPPASAKGQLRLAEEGQPMTTRGQLSIDEPGAATEVSYELELPEAGVKASVSSLTRLHRPARLRDLGSDVELVGELATRARYDGGDGRLDSELRVNLQDLRAPGLSARRFDLAAHARGDVEAPRVELLANLTGLAAAERSWSRVRVLARGTSEELDVQAQAHGKKPERITLHAALAPTSERLVRAPLLRVSDPAGQLVLRARDVRRRGERLEVRGLTLEGAGQLSADVSFGSGLDTLSLEAKGLDAGRLLDIFGVELPLRSALLDVSAELDNRRRPRGKLAALITDIGVGRVQGGRLQADFALEAGKLAGQADVSLGRGAKTRVSVEGLRVPLGGEPLPSLETLTGSVELQGELDLARLQPLLPLGGIERATGQVTFGVSAQRPAGARGRPELQARLETRSLVLVSERPDVEQTPNPEQAGTASPWTLRDVDLELSATLARATASLRTRVFDEAGDFVSLDANLRDLNDLADPRRAFMRAPFEARLIVPRRELERWPAPIRPSEVRGALTLQVDANGTLGDPRVQARGRVDHFSAAVDARRRRRVDVELGAEYRAAGGRLRLDAHERLRKVIGLESSWRGDVVQALAALDAPEGASPLAGDVRLRLDEFPVELVPELQARHIRGRLSGAVELTGLGEDARFALDLGTDRLSLDRLALQEVRATAEAFGGELRVGTHLAGEGGQATLALETGLAWGDRLVPVLDPERVQGSLRAESFALGILQPLLGGGVSELGGKIDADIQATMQQGAPRLSGRAALNDGVLHLPSVGQRFNDIEARVAISPDRVLLEELRARGVTGGFEAQAEARLDGLVPTAANATLSIDEDDKLPLTVEGESVGDAWGKIETAYQRDEQAKRHELQVTLEEFNIELPASPPQSIQSLEQAEHVRVGYFRRDGEFVPIPLQPMEEPSPPSEYQTVVSVDLGELSVEMGDQADVTVGGQIQAKLDPELDVTGKIETRRGRLDISGREFTLERGTVTFTGGAPDTPIISAVARYEAPGYLVYAEYTGTATQGSLSLRSEPPLSQDEILTLLLFGTPDGSFGAGAGDTNQLSRAVSLVGSTAAQGLNRALSQVTDLDVSARVDTSTGAPRPELVVQLTPRVAARVTQSLGEPAPGQSPDRTFITIELRIASSWALSTMVGDRGASALDLIWRRRY